MNVRPAMTPDAGCDRMMIMGAGASGWSFHHPLLALLLADGRGFVVSPMPLWVITYARPVIDT